MSEEAHGKPNPAQVSAVANICGTVVLAANAILNVAVFRAQPYWGPLSIMILLAPIVNGILLIVFVALAPLVEKMAHGASVKLYLAVAAFLPLALIPCQFFVCLIEVGSL